MVTPKDYAEALEESAVVSGKICQLEARDDITNGDPMGLKKTAEMRVLLKQRDSLQKRIAEVLAELMKDPKFNRLHRSDD